MSKNKYNIIAIDGAAGSGKSTTAKSICNKFNYIHVDTGLHYRTICNYFLSINIKPEDVNDYLLSHTTTLDCKLIDHSLYLVFNDQFYESDVLRNESLNKHVSLFARLAEIRSLLLSYQRNLCNYAQRHGFSGIVMDGRDIGSVVLPNADLKIFLHADLQIRQSRRCNDGENDSISGRDSIDSTRKIAPLVCPDGALSINTGILSLNEVLSLISNHISNLK